ncbi:hypothetical protein ACCO45_010352 [Purpureocillium lilacinum]|uniref:Uncharacterized protein n=1 Tax=Purpureocillium lilacinum TaxID=33203 RepID=A0ACC4DG23_PURLI
MVGSIRRGDGRLGQGAYLCGASNRNGGGQRRWVTHTREMGAEEGVLHRMEGLPARFHEASSLGNPEREGAADLGVRRRPPRRPFGASDPRQDRPLSVSGRLSEQNSTPRVFDDSKLSPVITRASVDGLINRLPQLFRSADKPACVFPLTTCNPRGPPVVRPLSSPPPGHRLCECPDRLPHPLRTRDKRTHLGAAGTCSASKNTLLGPSRVACLFSSALLLSLGRRAARFVDAQPGCTFEARPLSAALMGPGPAQPSLAQPGPPAPNFPGGGAAALQRLHPLSTSRQRPLLSVLSTTLLLHNHHAFSFLLRPAINHR